MRPENETTSGPRSPGQATNGSSAGQLSLSRKLALGDYTNGNGTTSKVASNGTDGLHTNGKDVALLPKTTAFGHNREELTRIMMQSLEELGYHNAAQTLRSESGVELEGPTISRFRDAVLKGRWAEVEHLLLGRSEATKDHPGPCDDYTVKTQGLDKGARPSHGWKCYGLAQGPGREVLPQATEFEIKFWIRRQKYLELLEAGQSLRALEVLQKEITTFKTGDPRVNKLSALMMCTSPEELRQTAEWDGVNGGSRTFLLSSLSRFVPPTLMIPESRLENLLSQTKDFWTQNCLYHTHHGDYSLYTDHECPKDSFPLKCQHTLSHHEDEVWYLKFSNDGTKLATTSRDHTICIYSTEDYSTMYRLDTHEAGVCYVAWSPDDTKLISCAQAQDNSCKLWSLQTGQELFTLQHYTYAVTSAAWAPNGQQFVTGSQDMDHALELYNVDGKQLHHWTGENFRVHDVAITPDGSTMVVLTEKAFAVYDFHTRDQLYDYQLDLRAKLTSLSISHDSRSMLLSMNANRMQLRDIHSGAVQAEFGGHKQTQYIIRSAFGGADESFVVSGSEDSHIYIWRRNGALVEALDAHEEGCVNAVAWHPTDARIFASAGDDHKVRIWCPLSWSASNTGGPFQYY